MDEFMINVSNHGQFVFRTDWDSDVARVRKTLALIRRDPGIKVTVNKRQVREAYVDVTSEFI